MGPPVTLIPDRERLVSVEDVDGPLTRDALSALLLGREAYRRTRYIVARRNDDVAVLEVRKRSATALFSEIVDVRTLADPSDCQTVHDPGIDVSVPSQMIQAAAGVPHARCVVVAGRYGYVSFVLDPAPVVIRIVDATPPDPPKLVDQARRVLAIADDLPPVRLDADLIDLRERAERTTTPSVLFPCRASGLTLDDTQCAYLDQRPPRADWQLVGCQRSREIHRWFYGDEPVTIDTCPRNHPGDPAGRPTLTRCCLLEHGIERTDDGVVVPWGATLGEVRDGLVAALDRTPVDRACRPG